MLDAARLAESLIEQMIDVETVYDAALNMAEKYVHAPSALTLSAAEKACVDAYFTLQEMEAISSPDLPQTLEQCALVLERRIQMLNVLYVLLDARELMPDGIQRFVSLSETFTAAQHEMCAALVNYHLFEAADAQLYFSAVFDAYMRFENEEMMLLDADDAYARAEAALTAYSAAMDEYLLLIDDINALPEA